MVAGGVAGGNGDGIVALVLLQAVRKFTAFRDYGEAAVNLDNGVGVGLAGDGNNFLGISPGGAMVGGRND